MNFLRTLFWIVLTAVIVVFSINNWTPRFQVRLWSGLVADTHVPVLMVGSFLAGLLPALAVHRATRWRLRRRLHSTQAALAAAAPAIEPLPATVEPVHIPPAP